MVASWANEGALGRLGRKESLLGLSLEAKEAMLGMRYLQ